MRLFAIAALSLGLALPALPQAAPETPYTIRQDVVNIVVPVTVRRSDGMPVGGIRPQQFRLFDNRKLQDIKVDADYLPVSVVMVVQANSRAEGAVKRVKETPALVQSLIVGEQGEAAVLAFDHRMQVKSDFTTDYDKLKAAVEDIKVGSNTAALNDAVMTAINMLKRRDQESPPRRFADCRNPRRRQRTEHPQRGQRRRNE
ncbi:MAG: hypothetical protein U5J83_16540 [Bryobacterales bacterium]|nr:hypothetical protein [Bryobacterales bacterium]